MKQLLLNYVATVLAEHLTQMYSFSVQRKSTLLGLVCFVHCQTTTLQLNLMLKCRFFNRWVRQNPLSVPGLNNILYEIPLLFPAFFCKNLSQLFFYVTYTLASLTVFLGSCLPDINISNFHFFICGTCNQSTMRGIMFHFSNLLP